MSYLKHRQVDEEYDRITPEEEERSQQIVEQQRRNHLYVDIITKVIVIAAWAALFIYGLTLLEN